eukprot:scaffold30072_cov88-Skeletonema_marinoi.AAC.4
MALPSESCSEQQGSKYDRISSSAHGVCGLCFWFLEELPKPSDDEVAKGSFEAKKRRKDET